VSQSRRWSFYEASINVAVGYLVALVGQIITFKAMGIPVSLSQNILIGVIFTLISLARSYTLRRVFNWIGR
jgi:hypothetical protein